MSSGQRERDSSEPQRQFSAWIPFAPPGIAGIEPNTRLAGHPLGGTSSRSLGQTAATSSLLPFIQSPDPRDAGLPQVARSQQRLPPASASSGMRRLPLQPIEPTSFPDTSYAFDDSDALLQDTGDTSTRSNARASKMFRERRKQREKILRETVTQLAARNLELERLLRISGINPPLTATLQAELPLDTSQRAGGPPINIPGLSHRHSESDLQALQQGPSGSFASAIRRGHRHTRSDDEASLSSSGLDSLRILDDRSLDAFLPVVNYPYEPQQYRLAEPDTPGGRTSESNHRSSGSEQQAGPYTPPEACVGGWRRSLNGTGRNERNLRSGLPPLQSSELPLLPRPPPHCAVGDAPQDVGRVEPPLTMDYLNLQRLLYSEAPSTRSSSTPQNTASAAHQRSSSQKEQMLRSSPGNRPQFVRRDPMPGGPLGGQPQQEPTYAPVSSPVGGHSCLSQAEELLRPVLRSVPPHLQPQHFRSSSSLASPSDPSHWSPRNAPTTPSSSRQSTNNRSLRSASSVETPSLWSRQDRLAFEGYRHHPAAPPSTLAVTDFGQGNPSAPTASANETLPYDAFAKRMKQLDWSSDWSRSDLWQNDSYEPEHRAFYPFEGPIQSVPISTEPAWMSRAVAERDPRESLDVSMQEALQRTRRSEERARHSPRKQDWRASTAQTPDPDDCQEGTPSDDSSGAMTVRQPKKEDVMETVAEGESGDERDDELLQQEASRVGAAP